VLPCRRLDPIRTSEPLRQSACRIKPPAAAYGSGLGVERSFENQASLRWRSCHARSRSDPRFCGRRAQACRPLSEICRIARATGASPEIRILVYRAFCDLKSSLEQFLLVGADGARRQLLAHHLDAFLDFSRISAGASTGPA